MGQTAVELLSYFDKKSIAHLINFIHEVIKCIYELIYFRNIINVFYYANGFINYVSKFNNYVNQFISFTFF
jgi:hypothetical protein